jgi:carotenoid cleavage dioxygenase
MFVRNGPNPQFSPIGRYHWFDGDGMLHGVLLSDGKAQYCNRYVGTKGFLTERDAGHALWTGIVEMSQPSSPDGSGKNTANTALVWHAGQMLALWEGGAPHKIKLPSLETDGLYTYNGKLVSAFTAHPKVDPGTGEMMFFGYSPATPPYLQYGIVSAGGELLRTVPIDLPIGVMMHDFAITEHYTIFMDLPLTFSIQRMQRGEPVLMFEPERPSRFGIVPRHGDNSSIRWFESPACYVFHTLNAYEEGDEVVLVACRMNSTTVLMSEKSGSETEGESARLYRWRFNLSNGMVREEALDDRPSDFPRVNEQLLGRPTRYGYTAKMAPTPLPLFDGLIKYDLTNGSSQTHEFGRRRYGGEAVFVPRPGATAEDDGWLLTFVYDEVEETSELVVVNALDVTAEPIARVVMPRRVPYGFHGSWVSQEQFSS